MEVLSDWDAASLVCNFCWTEIFSRDEFRNMCHGSVPSFFYEAEWQIVLGSATDGCNWCKLISLVVLKSKGETVFNSANIKIDISGGEVRKDASPKGANTYRLSALITALDRQLSHYNVYLSAFTSPTDRAAMIVTARDLQTNVSSASVFREARGWLSDCANHETCRQFTKDVSLVTLPTRVIEVAPHASSQPRLLHAKGMKGSYAALSYCWGKQQRGVLTTETLGSYIQQLDLDVLAQTVKDAILCTRQLGIKYLWCDALCILQDDESDMARELSYMEEAYGDAYLTIVAASAADATEGFLQNRPLPNDSFTVPFPCSAGVFGTMSLRRTERNDFGLDHVDASPEPTNRRAWTLQEKLLSHRLLIFASNTLQYQCECAVQNLGASFFPGGPRLRLSTSRSTAAEARLDLVWGEIVGEYSKRNLTKASDKLVALAGIAAYLAPHFQCEYYAGLWQSSLFEHLHWTLIWPRNPRPTYRAPSWSWASVDGPVDLLNFGNTAEPYNCTIIKCQTTLKRFSLPFGEVAGGRLELRAVIRRGYYSNNFVMLEPWHDSTARVLVTENISEPPQANNRPDQRIFVILDTVDDDIDREVYCLALSKIASSYEVRNPDFPSRKKSVPSSAQEAKDPGIGGLVLTLSTDGFYRRIGRLLTARLSYFENLPQQEVIIV